MKTFEFDTLGNMTVKDGDGRQWDIQRDQIASHLPMFVDEMPADVLDKAKQIAGIE